MHIDLFQIDAFAEAAFTGNPAAVCPLKDWLPDELMQAIAAENNLSETAFLVQRSYSASSATSSPAESAVGSRPRYELRWFTPTVEVDLCGHATLASGHVVLNHLCPDAASVDFDTRSGLLGVARETDGSLRMELPADPRPRMDPPAGLASILGAPPVEVLGGSTWVAVMADAETVTTLVPDIEGMSRLDPAYVCVTAPGPPGSDLDFVSRFFAPGAGIAEDPVTGSAHCALMPYWSERLGRGRLRARQVSARGGNLDCELVGDRVVLRARCVEVLSGAFDAPVPGEATAGSS